MRLSKFEIDTIKQSVYSLDPQAKVYLFGSRVDDKKRGGDIDLLIFSKKIGPGDKIKLKAAIFKNMEEQRIDIIISKDAKRPFVRYALDHGVLL